MSEQPLGESSHSVLLVSQFFRPDTSANSIILSELADGLNERGVDVEVVTTQPSYTQEDREKSFPKIDEYEGVRVRRLPATRFDRNDGIVYRMLNELSFFVAALFYVLTRRGDATLLLPTAPTFLPILGLLVTPLRGKKYVPIVMDLYPEMAVQLGYLDESSVIYRCWEWLNGHTFRKAAAVVVIGETMKETLEARYGTECNVTVIHNWAKGDRIKPKPKEENPFSRKHDLVEGLTLLYSGNLGRHHDLESLVVAADEIEANKDEHDVNFLFIGEGGKKPELERMTAERNLDSVIFLPYQPKVVLPNSLTSGDITVVSMEEGVEGLCVSSKFYTSLASGQAILAICSRSAEIGRVVEETGCGIRVDPGHPEQIADAVEAWLEDPEKVEKMGSRARETFERKFTRERAIDEYIEVLRALEEG